MGAPRACGQAPFGTAEPPDAWLARIWGGFHFRKAMVEAYDIGHRTAERVMAAVD